MVICALWSPAGKRPTSRLWLLAEGLSLFHWYPPSGVILDVSIRDLYTLTY